MEIIVEDISSVFPRPLEEDEQERAEALIKQAVELIAFEFARRGRDLAEEVETTPWLQVAVLQAVRIMVSRAVLIGENVGHASASSTSGPQSDSITFSQGVGIHWGGVGMDQSILDLLGLHTGPLPRGRGGLVIPFGTRWPVRRCAEGAERPRWC